MARLNTLVDSDDEFPDLSTILSRTTVTDRRQESEAANPKRRIAAVPSTRKEATNARKPLRIAHVDSLFIPFLTNQNGPSPEKGVRSGSSKRSSPRRALRNPARPETNLPVSSDFSDLENASSDHMSDFIVLDSESDDSYEDPKSRSDRRKILISGSLAKFPLPCAVQSIRAGGDARSPRKDAFTARGAPSGSGDHSRDSHVTTKAARRDLDDGFGEPGSILKFSPPRITSPSRSPPINRAVTPPTGPRKVKLLSPTKRSHIPPSPHRPSIDAFWSQEVINDWNNQYSPKKTPKSVHARRFFALDEDDDGNLSPCEGGRRSPSKSPRKRDKQAAEKRKAFNEKKYDLAAAFLKELDQTIVNGQIAALAESTGGVRLTWSKKLQSTAGRANWKRETVRSRNPDGTVSTTSYRHHAAIELAEKVIDDEDRLINVIAHEYCHLLNFMISNVKDHPHGKEFKVWAKKCSAAFAHRGINVTTKHTYEIAYKYIWACTHCGTEYKRHSKSIDPARHSCGKCKEKLVQVKPPPRREGKGISEYQKFVKERFSSVKAERPDLGMGEIMALLGKEFREMKGKMGAEMVVVEEKEVGNGSFDEGKDVGFDTVVRKLDFLDLGSG